jgi:lipopolysaccharide export system protein LptA
MAQGRQVGLLTGQGADLQNDGSIRLRTARVEYADAGGNTNANMIVLATNCVADFKRNVVWSPDGLSLRTADGQFALAGVGFVWSQHLNDLVVSNQVRTAVRKHAATPPNTNAVTLTISSESFRFNYASNFASFRGAVQAQDPEMDVACARLDVRRSASGKFDHILAEEDVQLTSRRDGSVTTAGRAEYTLSDEGELVELTGQPRWRDAQREARAERFVLERATGPTPQRLHAIGQAWIRLPAGTNDLGAWPLLQPAGTDAPTASEPPDSPGPSRESPSTNAPPRQLELAAEWITLVLPPTNGPVQSLLAQTNVTIRSRHDGWQAEARRATLTNAVLELDGLPVWTQGERSIRGDVLRLDTRDRSFVADGHARIRFPATALGATLPSRAETNRSALNIRSNLVVTIESDRAAFTAGRLRFAPPVRAELLDGDTEFTLGRLTCRDLAVGYGERLDQLDAEGDVRFEQFFLPDAALRTRWIECARLQLDFDADGHVRALSAQGGVAGRQEETRLPAKELLTTTVRANRLDATFMAKTNQVEHATAEGHLRLERGQRVAEGQRAEFTGTNGLLTLTGQPVVASPEGRVRDARALIWDSRTGRVRGEGPFRIEWLRVPTNRAEQVLRRSAPPKGERASDP